MPEQFRNMYKPEDIELPENFCTMPHFCFGWNHGRDENLETYPRRPEVVKKHIADYYAMISHIDWCVGNIVNALEKKGILDDTIIVLAGDNGLAVGQHGLMGKQNVYEHSIRVPLIMAGPGIPSGKKCDKYVYLLDIYPTLCELCNIPVPDSVEGKSFVPLLKNDKASIRDDLYFAFQAKIRAVKDGRYKLIEYRTEDVKLTQLFDLKNDPLEMNNMFGYDDYEEIWERLRARLFEMRDEWEDETHPYGKQFWDLYRAYEKAAPPKKKEVKSKAKTIVSQIGIGK